MFCWVAVGEEVSVAVSYCIYHELPVWKNMGDGCQSIFGIGCLICILYIVTDIDKCIPELGDPEMIDA